MCCTCNGFSLIWLNSSCPKPDCDQVSSQNPRPACIWRVSNLWVGHIQWNFLTSEELVYNYWFFKMESSDSQLSTRSTASIRRYTESENTFTFGFVCYWCWWPQRRSIIQQNKLYHYCTQPKLVTEENNASLCFTWLNKAKNKICAKNKDDIEACILDSYILYMVLIEKWLAPHHADTHT